MERGQAKAVTGKEHLERNDFIIEKQKAELQRIETIKRHKEQQVNLAEQELKMCIRDSYRAGKGRIQQIARWEKGRGGSPGGISSFGGV